MPLNIHAREARQGTVLLLTLMMLVLLTFEVAVISLVAQRGLGEEGMQQTQSIAARRGGEVALNQLEESLYNYLRQNGATNVDTAFAFGGSNDLDETPLQVVNPATGTPVNSDVNISAWLESRRGIWYHIVARARNGNVDLLLHRWVRVNPCNAAGGGVLSTIVSSLTGPGSRSVYVDPNGRLFFGGRSGRFYSWDKSTGLSTVVTGETDPGYASTAIAPDGRVFFGEMTNSGTFWSWKNNILSTIVSNAGYYPGLSSTVVGDDGRVFFGEDHNPGRFWTWKEDTGLTTIFAAADNVKFPGTDYEGIVAIHKPSSRVFFGEGNTAGASGTERFWSWQTGTGLSTIVSSGWWPGYGMQRTAAPDGRILFGFEGWCTSPCPLLTWKAGTGLSTIDNVGNYGEPMARQGPTITSDGRYYFGTWNQNNDGGFYTWKPGSGLSTIIFGAAIRGAGRQTAGLAPDGRVFFVGGGDVMFTYLPGTGLSTIVIGGVGTHEYGALHDDGISFSNYITPSGRIFFGRETTGTSLWTWHKDTGLSTIISGVFGPGTYGSLGVTDRERVYFGQANGASGSSIWTWDKTKGLSTIVAASAKYPGNGATAVGPNGEMYMGDDGTSRPLLRWEPAPDCANLGF